MSRNKIKNVNYYRISQEILRNKALKNGVNLVAPETIFLSKDTKFGKNVTIEPYVVLGPKAAKLQAVKIGLEKNMRHLGFEATFFASLFSESLLSEQPGFDSHPAQTLKACNFEGLGPTGPKIIFF